MKESSRLWATCSIGCFVFLQGAPHMVVLCSSSLVWIYAQIRDIQVGMVHAVQKND